MTSSSIPALPPCRSVGLGHAIGPGPSTLLDVSRIIPIDVCDSEIGSGTRLVSHLSLQWKQPRWRIGPWKCCDLGREADRPPPRAGMSTRRGRQGRLHRCRVHPARPSRTDRPSRRRIGRAFLLAHRWALDSAKQAFLTVHSEQRTPIATSTCRVATPAALVAMKLQSAPRRRATGAHKGPNAYGDLHNCSFSRSRSSALSPTFPTLLTGSAVLESSFTSTQLVTWGGRIVFSVTTGVGSCSWPILTIVPLGGWDGR